MAKELIKGNVAIAEAAIRCGLQAYFGYPITPQTELLEWMAQRMPEMGRAFVQAESELGAINMVYGAACCGRRAMTSSSGPGISLMMEGVSFIQATEVPTVIVDVMRGGPGIGNISPTQADYHQVVHGGGHGDYRAIVLAPSSVQETIDLTGLAFDLAEKYRMVAWVLLDGILGQMMEPAELPPMRSLPSHYPDWAVSGARGREKRYLSSVHFDAIDLEETNLRILRRWRMIEEKEVRYREYFLDDARFVVVGFGSAGRVALTAVRAARAAGIPVGLVRPITLSPFPKALFAELSKRVDGLLVVEMNSGQMLDDVLLSLEHQIPVEFYGRMGGAFAFPEEILTMIHHLAEGKTVKHGRPRDHWLRRMLNEE